MAEEVKKEDVKITEEDSLKLAKIKLGKDYTAILTSEFKDPKSNRKIEIELHVHTPTIKEELQMAVRERQLVKDKVDNEAFNIALRMIATLDIVTDKIYLTFDDEQAAIEFNGTFWDFIQGLVNIGQAYREVIFPCYTSFIKFQTESEGDFDKLKKSLAQVGKK